MFGKLKRHIEQRKLAKRRQRFQEGFNWATSELASGNLTPQEVSAHTQSPDQDEFDRGADFAVMKAKDSSHVH